MKNTYEIGEKAVKKYLKYLGRLSGSTLGLEYLCTSGGYQVATVVKIAGIQWFNRMEEGVNQCAKDNNVNAFQVGPAEADPQQTADRRYDCPRRNALAVVPMSPEALNPCLNVPWIRGLQ